MNKEQTEAPIEQDIERAEGQFESEGMGAQAAYLTQENGMPVVHAEAGLTRKESEAVLNDNPGRRKVAGALGVAAATGAAYIFHKSGFPFTEVNPKLDKDMVHTVRGYGSVLSAAAVMSGAYVKKGATLKRAEKKLRK